MRSLTRIVIVRVEDDAEVEDARVQILNAPLEEQKPRQHKRPVRGLARPLRLGAAVASPKNGFVIAVP